MANWFVCCTVPQREFKAADELAALGLMTLVPYEVRHRKQLGKGNRPVMVPFPVPLMPSYVFLGTKDVVPWYDVRSLRDVRGQISFDGTPARLGEIEIARIRAMAADIRHESHKGLRLGDRVSITDGPFRSLEGLVEAIGLADVTVSVELFGSVRPVRHRPDQIERAA